MNNEQEKPHRLEIIRYANSPASTKVWCKRKSDRHWCLQKAPSWLEYNMYIVDDANAEERKRELDNA